MDKIEKIRQEIERRKNYISVTHFAEELLSFLSTLSEEPDKSLEKAAKEYVKDIPTFKDSCLMKAAFEDGWLCSKEQMLKDAEPAEIGYFNQRGLSILTEKAIERMPVSEGDKVRIIIVKED